MITPYISEILEKLLNLIFDFLLGGLKGSSCRGHRTGQKYCLENCNYHSLLSKHMVKGLSSVVERLPNMLEVLGLKPIPWKKANTGTRRDLAAGLQAFLPTFPKGEEQSFPWPLCSFPRKEETPQTHPGAGTTDGGAAATHF